MLLIGNQLKAARALIGMDQTTLAEKAGVSKNTVVALERAGSGVLKGRLDTVHAIAKALEEAGVEFLNHGQPGVRLKVWSA